MLAPLRLVVFTLALLAGLAAAPGAHAQQARVDASATASPASQAPGVKQRLEAWDDAAAEIRGALDGQDPGGLPFNRYRTELENQAEAVPPLVNELQARAEPVRSQLEALGPPPEEGATETEPLAAERERLTAELAEIEADIGRLNQAKARAETMIRQLIEKRRALFTERMREQGPVPLDPQTAMNGLKGLERVASRIASEIGFSIRAYSFGWEQAARVSLGVAVLIFLIMGLRLFRKFALSRLGRMLGPEATQARRVTVGLLLTIVRVVTPGLAVAVLAGAVFATGLLGATGMLLLTLLLEATLLFIGAWALSLAYFAPSLPLLRLAALEDPAAKRAHRWVVSLAGLYAVDRALVDAGGDLGFGVETLAVMNAILVTAGGLVLLRVIRQIARWNTAARAAPSAADDDDEEAAAAASSGSDVGLIAALAVLARLVGRAIAIAGPLLALAGYFAASRYIFYSFVESGAVIGVGLLLYQVVQAGVERLDWLRANAEGGDGPVRSLRLIPLAVGFVLVCVTLPLIALVWGASLNDLQLVWRRIVEGVTVGEMQLSPAVVLTFVLVFLIGYAITRMIQSVLGRSVLPLTGIDTGGRDAIRAGVGYAGVALALLFAISSAGIDMSNLAIALGALSVGIGFGLQNVVNNFVSGLILLIERPIKTGDWIELGSGTGYVKKINVRSTEIETFDRSSLIVPNSELIAAPVVNWTHTSNNGRIIVPVGVAYGTDPRKVERILLEVARGHPMLLRRPAPFVLFQNFGPNALEFEIRGVLRDVNWVLNVGSDLRYEVARRFREEGIVIPFAQRDLHLKNPVELAEALAAAPAARRRRAGSKAEQGGATPGREGPPDGTRGDGRPREPRGRAQDHDDEAQRPRPAGRPAGTDPDGGAGEAR